MIKTLVLGVLVALVFGGLMYLNPAETMVVTNPSEPIVEVEVVEESDIVAEARRELERINVELDAEETRLLEEIKERQSRIEEIRETRASF